MKDSVLIDQYMGWSHAGNTRQKYQHYYNDDSFDAMLTMMDGLKPIAPAKGKVLLKPRLCPNCQETNTPESRFCAKCKFVLSFDAFNETIADAENTKKQLEQIKTRQSLFESVLKKIIASEEDWDPRNSEEKKRIDDTFHRIMDPNSGYFGE